MIYHLVVKEPTTHKITTPNLVHHLTWKLLTLEHPMISAAMAVAHMGIAGELRFPSLPDQSSKFL
jgi:hypothetical protein